jgi:hypothetical protein
LSHQAEIELNQLRDQLGDYYFDADVPNQWQPLWNGDYTAKKFYNHIYDELEAHHIFHIIWRSNCMSRIKFFTWLILVDRLNTKTMLTRRHIRQRDDDLCIMCALGEDEIVDHLFFNCPFAAQCWDKLDIIWDLSLDMEDRVAQPRQASGWAFFTEVVMIATWRFGS